MPKDYSILQQFRINTEDGCSVAYDSDIGISPGKHRIIMKEIEILYGHKKMKKSDNALKKDKEKLEGKNEENDREESVCPLTKHHEDVKEEYFKAVGCAVCIHPKKSEIDKLLKEGHPYSAIKEKFNVTKCALSLHKSNCLKQKKA